MMGAADQVWIGFSDGASEGTWVWMDGTPTDYTVWGPGEPNNYDGIEHNAIIKLSGGMLYWEDVSGTQERHSYPSVCKKGAA